MLSQHLKNRISRSAFWTLAFATSAIILGVFALYAEAPLDGFRKAGRWNNNLTVTGRFLPDAVGLEAGDKITSVDKIPLAKREIKLPLRIVAELRDAQSFATYEIERNGEVMEVTVPLQKAGWWRMLLVGGVHSLLAIFFIITASILYMRSGSSAKSFGSTFYQSQSIRVICYALVFGALTLALTLDITVRSGASWLGLLFLPLPFTYVLTFGLILHFVLIYPQRDNIFTRSRWAVYALHSSYLSLPVLAVVTSMMGSDASWLRREARLIAVASLITCSTVVVFRSYRRATGRVEKNQLRWLAWGATTGVSPWLLIYVLPSLAGFRPFVDHRIVLLFMAMIPISVLIAVSRYKLLEIDGLIRRSIIYSISITAMTVLYLMAFASITWFIEFRAGISDPITSAVMSALLLALAFNPLRTISERLVEKFIHRGSVNPRKAFSQLSLAISQVIRLPQLSEILIAKLPRSFVISGSSLIVLNDDDQWQVYADSEELYSLVTAKAEKLISDIKSKPDLWPSAIYPLVENATEKEISLPAGLEICFPMSVGGKLAGIYMLGGKLSDRLYGRDELDTLRTLVHHAATVLDNACAYQQLNDLNSELERLVELRTQQLQQAIEELGQKNNDLIKQNAELARLLHELRETQAALVEAERRAAIGEIVITVCHEINNPLSAIIGQAQLIQLSPDGVPDRIMEKVRIIDQCSERIHEITDKMRNLKSARAITYAGQEKMIDLHHDEAAG